MTPINPANTEVPDTGNPSLCNTQVYYDRDVKLVRCYEEKHCRYKKYFNKMIICDCPDDNGSEPEH